VHDATGETGSVKVLIDEVPLATNSIQPPVQLLLLLLI
jgi:hypothetical protein